MTRAVEIKLFRYGRIIYRPGDTYIGKGLYLYGEFSEGEVELFRKYITKEDVVVDVGANIGCHTIVFARIAKNVIAFEAQRPIFQILCGNMAINDFRNVVALNEAIGQANGEIKVPVLDYSVDNNLGSTSLQGHRHDGEGLQTELCRLRTIDSIGLAKCDFIKADIEGMELDMLLGATQTIEKFRPILYVENDDPLKSPALLSHLLIGLHYKVYWHIPALFNPNNFEGVQNNIFGGIGSANLLCLPAEKIYDDVGLPEVTINKINDHPITTGLQ